MSENDKSEIKDVKAERRLNMSGAIGISERFATLNKLITRDLNNNTNSPTCSLYTKDDITTYLSNPYTYRC